MLYPLLILSAIQYSTHGILMTELTNMACSREPSLSFCNNTRITSEPLTEKLVSMSKMSDKLFRNKESNIAEGNIENEGYLGDVKNYCKDYRHHYEYYCIGEKVGAKNKIHMFCHAYSTNCVNNTSQLITSQDDKFDRLSKDLKKLVPCKPDCDQGRFSHCTAQCKCDYLKMIVKKYCYPVVPIFERTCSLWFQGCLGVKDVRESVEGIAYGVATSKRDILHLPPPLPPSYKEKLRRDRLRRRHDESEIVDVFEKVNLRNKRRRRIVPKKRRSPSKPPTDKDHYRTLKIFSDFTRQPIQATKDLINQGTGDHPKAQAATSSFPVLLSDASYGATGSGDAFKNWDGLTDSRGILHRPKSTSPFTKPGLWAANPDDPHNRDHANRYFYRPSSVGVDWLNGQITWGAHWAVPAAQVGGTDGFSAVHFPTIGNFLNIPDDYD